MGTCNSQKNTCNTVKQINQVEVISQFTTIRELMHFFDQISLEKLNFPDLSAFLSKHINKNRVVNEGKTWVAINEVKTILNNKTAILIRNFNPETDAAIQLIYLLKQLIEVSMGAQELSTSFNENAVELFHYYQAQLVQVSIEVLLAVNTLVRKQEYWWKDNYFNWRSIYIQTMFKIQQPFVEKIDLIGPFYGFIALLKQCAQLICNQQKSPDLIEIDIKAQQEVLEQFYSQIRTGFLQNQSSQLESINWERQIASKSLGQQLQLYHLYINKKNYTS
ncbi:unnamed protein product (macronuclear) [Paramecium tetraurelia]|uniref:Uncharacterized protein n=1 Tax=Paramecium tetraurelia TaxID=5888 RepID=A0EG42_PARTE|nr:uncharacterized protein GSPATT00026606001 [Paramecium tetraurelia]CAK94283.1 unnamed protein product [Paramecium tetraurelia]|eukprot:XP_001461656.1 hypothetical protein (macronuclear) [Paramecium tetraurelia strain d4-2]